MDGRPALALYALCLLVTANAATTTTTTTTITTTTTTTANNNNQLNYNGQTLDAGDIFTFPGSAYASGGDYYFHGVSTMLTGHANVGDTSLTVATEAGFQLGDLLFIGGLELIRITGFSSINLQSALQHTHGSGSTIAVVVPASGTVGGDPIAMYGNERREFWLPTGVLHPVMHMPELNIAAQTFPGEWGEQWFNHIVVTSPGGFRIADISIKDIAKFNKSTSPKDAFETLNVRLGTEDAPMAHMPHPEFLFERNGVFITFMRLNQMKRPVANQFKINGARRDVVMIACKTAHLLIVASPASEYSSFRPDMAIRYSHLDIIALELHQRHALRGLLPELWGMRTPMSNRTKSFLVAPRERDDNSGKDTPARFLSNKIADLEEDGSRTVTTTTGALERQKWKREKESVTCAVGDNSETLPCTA